LEIAKRLAADAPSELRCAIELISASPHIDTGSVDKARRTAVWAFDVANSNEQLLPRSRALGNMGLFTLYLGNSTQARKYLVAALQDTGELSFVRLGLADSLASVALFEGNLEECRRYLDEVNALIATHQVPSRSWYDLAHQITRCLYLSHVEEWAHIVDVVDAAHPELERRQLRVWHSSLLSAKARALAHLGRHDEAEDALLAALRLCPRGAVDPLITVEAATGTCLTLRGDTERGARHFGRALRACQAISHRFYEWAVTKERDAVTPTRAGTPAAERRSRTSTDDINLMLTDISTLLSAGHSIDVMAHRLAAVISGTPMHSRLEISTGAPASVPVSWDSGSDGTHRIVLSEAERSLVLTVRGVHLLEDVSLLRNLVEIAKTAVSQTGDRRQQDEDLLWPQVPLPSGGDAVFWSPRMQEVLRVALKLAMTDLPVLITGETGTGKEVIARLIHANSKWSRGPFVPYNASTVQKELVESQMFGHRRGAFTGALESSGGVIRAAENGTLFLDEIGDLDTSVQPKLLRFLESGEIHALGDPRPSKTRVRIVAATNASLENLVAEGRFRSDLFYRLRVATISMPPLRERKDEIPALAATFVRRACKESGRRHLNIGADFVAALLLHEWPGNIRQLANEVRRAVALADDGATLSAQDLSPEIAAGWVAQHPLQPPASPGPIVAVRLDQSLDRAVDDIERAFVERALEQTRGRVSDAARLLGISRKGLFLKRKKLGLD
jgi:two-component system response regulator AtoC